MTPKDQLILHLILRLAGALACGNLNKIQTVAASVKDDAQKALQQSDVAGNEAAG